jgi:adenylate cyclase
MSETYRSERLAVILHADIAGSTVLVQQNELLAHERIQEAFNRFDNNIERYHGKVLELRGDALLAEFERASDAVAAALAHQADQAYYNSRLKDDLKPSMRVGIAMGEVVIADGTITGAGVVLAQRVEQLADPGGLCITAALHESLPRRMPFELEDLGDQELKGFDDPVHVYRVELKFGASIPSPVYRKQRKASLKKRSLIAATIFIVLVVIGVSYYGFKAVPWESLTPLDRTAAPLPDKPSIAVLPFLNLSDDKEQEYFAEGMSEDLITDLSKVSGLFVIARNSSFAFKGQQFNVAEVAKELGVRYVLQGSVRKSGERVRINTQLIDSNTGGHAWAERYEGNMTDVFLLQDEVTNKIITALAVKLTGSERRDLALMPTESLEAYDSFLRAERSLFSQNSEELAAALSHYRKATEIDPNFARAWAGHARAAVDILRFDWFDVMPGHHARRQAYESASRALLLDPNDARAYSVLAILQMVESRHDESIESARKGVVLSPSDADALLNLALVLSYAGEHDEAIRTMKAALKLNPKPPSGFYRLTGFIQFMSRNYEEAENLLINARNVSSPDPSHEELAMIYAQMGKTIQANAEVDGMLTLWPEANLTYYRVLYSHHKRQEDLDFRINALRKAGLPQWPYGYEGREEDRLTHKEIKHLLFDRIWRGFRVGAEEFNRENNEDGIVGFRDPKAHPGRSSSAYMLSGTATIDGDKLCYQYEEFLLGRKYCGYVFRNPKGSDREKYAYVDVNAIVIDYFTAGPEGSVR